MISSKYPIQVTPLKQPQNQNLWVRQLLLNGTAEFHTGRLQPVFFFCAVTFTESELRNPDWMEGKTARAVRELERMAEMPEKTGWMYHVGRKPWNKKKVRAVRSVQWHPWGRSE